jgi:hypothetical protein
MAGGIYIILDSMQWEEIKNRQRLYHQGGQLLLNIINRLSIPKDKWMFGYCFEGNKKQLPTKKVERQTFLVPHLKLLQGRVTVAKEQFGDIRLIGLGKLACECLTGSSELKKRSGTSWKVKTLWQALTERAWVTYSPEAALYDSVLEGDIARVIGNAAMKVGIELRFKTNDELPPFDYSDFL